MESESSETNSETRLMKECMKEHFGFSNFKSDIQQNAIKCVLSGYRDIYISMPTGSGKSLCYQLPGLMIENKVVIVISPLIALIKNQLDYLKSRNISSCTINSATGSKERDRILADLKAKKSETRFLYITAEQFATATFRELFKLLVKFQKIAFVAVDEAHCVSSWGHDFRKDYLKLGNWRKEFSSVQWIALTATAPKYVCLDIFKNLSFCPNPKIFQVSCFRKNLYYDIQYKICMNDDFLELKEYIESCLKSDDGEETPVGIIYCRKKDTTEAVERGLRKLGLACKAFHSSLRSSEKEKIQNEWMKGTVKVIAATIAFGMGVDKSSVRVVCHWDVPQSVSGYYQESGRAGRDGKKSFCRLYYDRKEAKSISFLLNQDMNKIPDKKSDKFKRAELALNEFKKVEIHCESATCRHLLFTNHFGDPPPQCDAMCDVCENKKKCIENLEIFNQLSMKVNLGGTFAMDDDDVSDLYEGGRKSKFNTHSFDAYENDNSDNESASSFCKTNEQARKQERDFINKQFALRKMQAAAAMEMQSTTQISRVKASQSTETKVVGLTISTREQNLSMIVSTLKQHMETCAMKNPPEYPTRALVYRDLEDLGVEIEYSCFQVCKAISIYRRNIAKQLQAIRTSPQIFEPLKEHVPKKHQSHGGDYKTIVKELRERYGSDVVNELQDEMQEKSQPHKKRKIEDARQTKISSFFVKNPSKSSASSSSDDQVLVIDNDVEMNEKAKQESPDNDLLQLEKMRKELEFELGKEQSNDDTIIQIDSEENIIISDDDKEIPKQPPLNDNLEIDDVVEVKSTHELVKKKLLVDEKSERMQKVARLGFQKASNMVPSEDSGIKKVNKCNKAAISKMVVKILDPFYREKKIASSDPKKLFKALARKITHHFLAKNETNVPQEKIADYIVKIFSKRGVITSEEDFM